MKKLKSAARATAIFIRDSKPLVAVLMVLTGIGVSITGVIFSQGIFRILPLYVSLFVMMLQGKANRYGYLLGSINSVIYTAVYLYYGLISAAFSTLLVSAPMQLFTFFRWSKRSYKKSTVFKRLSAKGWAVSILLTALFYIALHLMSSLTGGKYIILDSLGSALNFVSTGLTLLAYVEYTPFQLLSGIVGVLLNIQMIPDLPEQTTFLVYSIFATICITRGLINVYSIYGEQKSQNPIKEQEIQINA